MMAISKKLSTFILISVLIFSISFVIFPSGSAQTNPGRVVVKTDYEMLGFGELTGGGHITYELYGQAAGDLRRAVLAKYDWIGASQDYIDAVELKQGTQETPNSGYIADLEFAISQLPFFFHGVPDSYDPINEPRQEAITNDARGFVEVSNVDTDDTTPISIDLYFNSWYRTGSYEMNLVMAGLFDALYLPFEGFSDIRDPTGRTVITSNPDARDNYTLSNYRFEYKHTDYRVGLGSFSGLRTPAGSMHVIRTPAGEITTYSVKNIRYDGSDTSTLPQDSTRYSSFNFIENPQIMFIMVFISAYLMSSLPTKFYANYKYAYPRRLRHKALKIRWLHILIKVMILLLLLFYFFPTLFGFIGLKSFISGVILWIMAPVLTVVFVLVAKMLYDKLIIEIPQEPSPLPRRRAVRAAPPTTTTTTPTGVSVVVQQPGMQQPAQQPVPVPVAVPVKKDEPKGPPCSICNEPITDYIELEKCKCGALFHEKCRDDKTECPKCGVAFAGVAEVEEVPAEKSIQCPTCGEMNTVPEDADLMKTNCTACEVMLERIEPGYNYLIIDDDRRTAFEMFVSLIKKGSPGLCISTTFPDKLKKAHDMESSEIVWLTDTSSADNKTMNPHRLEFEMMRTYAGFVKNNKDAVVVLDGFEYMVVENGFEKVFKFIKKINDLSSVNSATLMVPIGESSLEPEQLGTLKKEFDKTLVVDEEKEE